ncbi:MAG: hypothetical protein ACYC6Y_19685, partial [Thermoguttaceae bacterium]
MHHRLLELFFGLLPEEEAERMRGDIARDAVLAEELARVEAEANLMGEAARVAAPRISLGRPELAVHSRNGAVDSSRSQPGLESAPWSPWAQWGIVIAAAVLVSVSLAGWARNRPGPLESASDRLRLQVTGPSRIQAGFENRYWITNTTLTGRPIEANVHFALHAPGGERLLGHTEKTGPEGTLEILVPADLRLPERVQLVVTGGEQGTQQVAECEVAVARETFSTWLSLDRPRCAAGEKLHYRSVSLSRFQLEPCPDQPLHFEVLDPAGAIVPGSGRESASRWGVASGQFAVPARAAGGVYTLVVSSLDPAISSARREFVVEQLGEPKLKLDLEFAGGGYGPGSQVTAALRVLRPDGTAAAGAEILWEARVGAETVRKDTATADRGGGTTVRFSLPAELGTGRPVLVVTAEAGTLQKTWEERVPLGQERISVQFSPEGGELAAIGENRVYFSVRDPQGEPVGLAGWIADDQGNYVAGATTSQRGRGVFRFSPRAGVRYRLVVERPADVQLEKPLPLVIPSQKIVINTGSGVFAAGGPIEFNVRASQAGLPLVAVAWCRGVQVGQRAFVTRTATDGGESKASANAVAIAVPDSAAGVVRLVVYDYSASPPRPIAQRLVYRRPQERLEVKVAADPATPVPGQPCRLGLRVVDEKGKGVPSLLALSVIEEGLDPAASPATMASHFWLTGETRPPEDFETDAGFLLGSESEAEAALDLFLGAHDWRRPTDRPAEVAQADTTDAVQPWQAAALGGEMGPPLMLDNLATLRSTVEASQDRGGNRSVVAGGALAALIVLGGAGLLVLVTMMSLLRIATGVRIWVPALVGAVASLIFASLIMAPGTSVDRSVAFAS